MIEKIVTLRQHYSGKSFNINITQSICEMHIDLETALRIPPCGGTSSVYIDKFKAVKKFTVQDKPSWVTDVQIDPNGNLLLTTTE